jgi:hypothetical protein
MGVSLSLCKQQVKENNTRVTTVQESNAVLRVMFMTILS